MIVKLKWFGAWNELFATVAAVIDLCNRKKNNLRRSELCVTYFYSPFYFRERLIHMLALRPYKKPEIYSKITNGKLIEMGFIWRCCCCCCSVNNCFVSLAEGVRDRERACIGTLLKSLSFMRDNTYHLHRHLWNDVHEDWPFYTEQDRQSLKR